MVFCYSNPNGLKHLVSCNFVIIDLLVLRWVFWGVGGGEIDLIYLGQLKKEP